MSESSKKLSRKKAKGKGKSKKDPKIIEIDSSDDENPLLDKLPLESVIKVSLLNIIRPFRSLLLCVLLIMKGPGRTEIVKMCQVLAL